MSDIVEREIEAAIQLAMREIERLQPEGNESDLDWAGVMLTLQKAKSEIESLRADKERLEGLIVAYKESLDTYEQVLETHGHDAAKKHLYPAIDNIVAEGDRIRKEREKGDE
jgi:predicted  nucleic acid-binding Zn-ribbon protein